MRRTPSLAAALLCCATILLAFPALTQKLLAQSAGRTETAEAPVIRVTGRATTTANPDLLQLQVAVVTRDTSATVAANENAVRVNAVLTALRALLGAGSAISTVSYSLEPEYETERDATRPRFVGYVARNVLRIETADLNKAGAIIDAAIAAGSNSVSGLTYTLRDQSKLRNDALAQAARDARAKADALAGGLGVRVGAVRTVEENARYMPMSFAKTNADFAATPIQSGPVEVEATVVVTYDIAR